MSTSRLGHYILGAVLLSILLFEALIFVPSYGRERERLIEEQRHAVTAAVQSAWRAGPTPPMQTELRPVLEAAGADAMVVLDEEGRIVACEGRVNAPVPSEGYGGDELVVSCALEGGGRAIVLLRGTTIEAQLLSFCIRVAGLVLILAAVVCSTVMTIFTRSVLRPLARLAERVESDSLSEEQLAGLSNRDDEIGVLARAVGGHAETVLARVSAEAERDAAVEASRLKSEFLANMSHELRTPIHGITGMTSALLDSELADEQRECAQLAARSANSLLDVVDRILDFCRLGAGDCAVEPTPYDPRTLAAAVDDRLRLRAADKGLAITCEVEARVPDRVLGDADGARGILANLVSNAIKFTERGEVAVAIDWIPAEGEQPPTLELIVRDSGIGISEDSCDLVFEPFVQLDASSSRAYGGTGIGLAICRRLVEAMAGSIGVKSEPDQGSTFRVLLPAPRPPLSDSRHDDSGAAAEPRPRASGDGSPRLLVVEDNLVNQRVAQAMLRKLGMEAEAVADGRQALERLAERPFDLVLMDCQMPVMDGFEATRALREREGPDEHQLIVAMTANALQGDRERCLAAGMDDHLGKPVSAEALGRVLERWLPSRAPTV
jgi:signal transduction histidine kinase/CheY-like chemotaxis protein